MKPEPEPTVARSRRRKWLGPATAAAFALFLLLAYALSKEPVYEGRTASEWAEILVFSQDADRKTIRQSEKAFKAMGEDGVNLLVDRLEKGDSEFMLRLKYEIRKLLGYKGKFYPPKERKLLYIAALGNLGTNAASATPCLLRHLDDTDADIRLRSAEALQFTRGHEKLVVPKMLSLLDSREYALSLQAVSVLRNYPSSKDEILPLVNRKIELPDFNCIRASAYTIKTLSPGYFERVTVPLLVTNLGSTNVIQVAASIQVLAAFHQGNRELARTMFSLLDHSNQMVRANAISPLAEWVNDGSSAPELRKTALAACIKLLDDPDEEVRVIAATSLLNWGADARQALTRLEQLYRSTPEKSYAVREQYRHVVFRLDPDRAFELQKSPVHP